MKNIFLIVLVSFGISLKASEKNPFVISRLVVRVTEECICKGDFINECMHLSDEYEKAYRALAACLHEGDDCSRFLYELQKLRKKLKENLSSQITTHTSHELDQVEVKRLLNEHVEAREQEFNKK